MAEDTFDLLKNYFLLEPDGAAIGLPGGMDFWNQLMSGAASDPGIRRLVGSEHGRLLTVLTMNADWTNWEMHPAGDELLFMLEGSATFLLDFLRNRLFVGIGNKVETKLFCFASQTLHSALLELLLIPLLADVEVVSPELEHSINEQRQL